MAATPHAAVPLLDAGSGTRPASWQRRKFALMIAGSMLMAVAAICGLVATLPNSSFLTELVSKPKVGENVGFHRAAHVFPPHVVKQMDLSVNPCDDFYKVVVVPQPDACPWLPHAFHSSQGSLSMQYACGGFEKRMQIPEDLGGFARSWDGGSAKIYKEMRVVLEKDKGKAGDWFRSCMMVDHVNELVSI
jgi:hypothetical protein